MEGFMKLSESREKDASSILTATSFAVSFIVIGLPLWWKTTEVYRVSLPYEETKEIFSLEIIHLIPVTIVLSGKTVHQEALWDEIKSFPNQTLGGKDNPKLDIRYNWKVRNTTEEEENAVKLSKSVSDMDKKLNEISKGDEPGSVQIIFLERYLHTDDTRLFVGCKRKGYISGIHDSRKLGENILYLVKTMTQSDILRKVFTPPSSFERRKPDKERMRSLSATTAFDITFSLLVPEPHIFDVRWDIEGAVNEYIMPFITKLSIIADVDVKSQVLYMTSLPIQSAFDAVKGEYILNAEQLPLIINPVEAKLSSYASVNPTLNFVLYIAPQEQSPLHIYDEKGLPVTTNAFLSPRWGGFLIHNFIVETANTSLPKTVNLNMKEVMEIFLGQLRLLLGLPDLSGVESKFIKISQDPKCCEWELDFLLRRNSQEQLSVAASSLYSLCQLLQTIGNIVIRDDVGEKIYSAVSAVKDSNILLQQGHLKEAFLQAKYAFTDSEEAFFDPTLLALLYFPDDQKYAIYIPLFLPVSIPVIISLRHLWTYWRNTRCKEDKLKFD